MNDSLTKTQVSTLEKNSPVYDPAVEPAFQKFLDERVELIITQVDIIRENAEWDEFVRNHPMPRNMFQKVLSRLHIHYSEL